MQWYREIENNTKELLIHDTMKIILQFQQILMLDFFNATTIFQKL